MSKEALPEYFKGYGVDKGENWNKPKLVQYKPKPLRPRDVTIEVECCGICGSDIHTLQGNWGPLLRKDLVVGHEIVGKVVHIGDEVTKFKIGDRVGLGARSNACANCVRCKLGNEQYCKFNTGTYNDEDPFADNYVTQGGYANYARGDENFIFAIPDKLDLADAAPLMCAGLTVYSPLVRGLGKDASGKTVGVIGIGGLGHLAIQFAKALGANVIAFSRSSSKRDHALKMGASELIATQEDLTWSDKYVDGFDYIINCASGFSDIDINAYISVLKVNGDFISVGIPGGDEHFDISATCMLINGSKLGQSSLGNKQEAIDMLELAAEKGVKPWIEKVPLSEKGCAEALTRCDKGDVRYRFVFTDYDKAFK